MKSRVLSQCLILKNTQNLEKITAWSCKFRRGFPAAPFWGETPPPKNQLLTQKLFDFIHPKPPTPRLLSPNSFKPPPPIKLKSSRKPCRQKLGRCDPQFLARDEMLRWAQTKYPNVVVGGTGVAQLVVPSTPGPMCCRFESHPWY